MKPLPQRILTVLVCLLAAGAAQAQSYPARPVRMIVPFNPGGSSDFVARIIQLVHIPYKGGAGAATTAVLAGEVTATQNEFWAKIVKSVGAVAE